MRKIPIARAADELPTLATKLTKKREVVAITRGGRPVLVVMPWELYESIIETLEIMADQELMASLKLAAQQVAEGRTVPWELMKRNWRV